MSNILITEKETSLLKRWHRRVGLSAAGFVLILATTGLFLNHAIDWHLDSRTLSSSALLNWYGIRQPEVLLSYSVGKQTITRVGSEVFLDTREIAHCRGELFGAVELSDQGHIVVGCNQELIIFTQDYELVERLGATHGLPSPLVKLGRYKSGTGEYSLVLADSQKNYLADLNKLTWSILPDDDKSRASQNSVASETTLWSEAIATPATLAEALGKHFVGEGITVERLLLDIHSGRIVGRWGILLVDIMAILFVVLAITGFVMWLRERSNNITMGN